MNPLYRKVTGSIDFGKSLPNWGKKSTGIPNFYYLNKIDVLEEPDSPIQNRNKRALPPQRLCYNVIARE